MEFSLALCCTRMAKAYIGTSGWNYRHWWNDEFYPKELKPTQWLNYFVRQFDTVEVNNSFYRLPSREMFEAWRKQAPPGFVFAVKASRFITHIKRLKDPEEPLDLFFSSAKYLKEHLGPILFQLPPQLKADLDRLEVFLQALDAHGARKHRRCVIEVREATWLVPAVFDRLRQHGVALCLADWRETHVAEPITADFVYLRRHYGPGKGGNYPKKELDRDVTKIRKWVKSGLDVYVYFNNDMGGHAVRNAGYVRDMCGRRL
jgi:uncharacterized protein YecE (DUF72 family)